MKVILKEDVKALGKKGDVVEVSDGYARNFILKTGKGVEANGKNLNDIVHILVSHLGLAYDTIAHYHELKTSELDEFLSKPEKYRNTYNLSLKLMNLFTAFVRDKKL